MYDFEIFLRHELMRFYATYSAMNRAYNLNINRTGFTSAGTAKCKSLIETYYHIQNNFTLHKTKVSYKSIDTIVLNAKAQIIAGYQVTASSKIDTLLESLEELPSMAVKVLVYTGRGRADSIAPSVKTENVTILNLSTRKLGVDHLFAKEK